MMPTIRISEANWERLKAHARPLEDSVDDVVGRALDALEVGGSAPAKKLLRILPKPKNAGDKTPQSDFRIPLLEALIALGNQAPAKKVRDYLEKKLRSKLKSGDLENVTSGDPRWWNAVCWVRNDLVKNGEMRSDTERGVWGISDKGTLVLLKRKNAQR
jgi:hypothetical protein